MGLCASRCRPSLPDTLVRPLCEIGRITIAATRVDREMALSLVAIRHSARLEELLTWSSRDLIKAVKERLEELFESNPFLRATYWRAPFRTWTPLVTP